MQSTPQMAADVLKGDITLTISLVRTSQRVAVRKIETTYSRLQISRKRNVNFIRENSTAGMIRSHQWMKCDTENVEQEGIIFVSEDEVKMQIHAVNEELPDELVSLLTRHFFRHVQVFF